MEQEKIVYIKLWVKLDYLFRNSYMSVQPVFLGFPGILDVGGNSYMFSKSFMFSLSKVVKIVVNPAYAISRSISAFAVSNVACA